MQFSERFKLLCKEKKVTQKKALADMGLHRNAVQSWNSGNPSADAIRKLSTYFDISADDLLMVENKKTAPGTGSGEIDIGYIDSLSNDELLDLIQRCTDVLKNRG